MGGSSTTTVTAPEPSSEELELLQQEILLAQQQLEQLEQFGLFQQEQFAATLPLIQQQADVQAKALELQQLQFEATQPLIGQQADLQRQLLELQQAQFAAQQPLVQQQAEVQREQLALQRQQLEQQGPLSALQAQLFEAQLQDQLARTTALGTPEEQAQRTGLLQDLELKQLQSQLAGTEQAQRLLPLQEQLATLQLEAIQRAAEGPSDVQLAQLEELSQAQIAAGDVDISRFEQRGLETLREELAPSLGLTSADTPILDRGARVVAEATRQRGQLAQNVRIAQLSAQQNLPLAQAQVISAGAIGQQRIGQATQQFQSQLQQAASINRLQLGGGFGAGPGGGAGGGFGIPQTGLGFSTAGQTIAGLPGIPSAGQTIAGTAQSGLGLLSANPSRPGQVALGLGQIRLGQASTTTTQDPGLLDIAGTIGGVMLGIGSIAAASGRLKTDIRRSDSTWDEVFDLSKLVTDYEMDGARQTGMIAQDLEQSHGELVTDTNIQVADMSDGPIKAIFPNSIFFKALKALGEALNRIEFLEARLDGVTP